MIALDYYSSEMRHWQYALTLKAVEYLDGLGVRRLKL